jgi:hypothetical protein
MSQFCDISEIQSFSAASSNRSAKKKIEGIGGKGIKGYALISSFSNAADRHLDK